MMSLSEISLANPSFELEASMKKYQAAIREMRVRFEILDDELEFERNRNPIHHIESRLKKIDSIREKLVRYGKPDTLESMQDHVMDIAGVRVICAYPDDVYLLFDALRKQDDLAVLTVKDYIANPKPNGYRSLHLIVKVPLYLMSKKEYVPVEIQFRTIAMDFWASLEHDLKYKSVSHFKGIDIDDELKNCADIIDDVQVRMQILMHALEVDDDEQPAHWPVSYDDDQPTGKWEMAYSRP